MKARYRLDDLVIDTGKRRITRGDVDLQATGLSFDLLLALGESAPDLLSADDINARVWPGQIVSPETIAQRVRMLRQSLGDSVATPRYIAGVRGHGYRLLSRMVAIDEPVDFAGDARAIERYVQARAIVRGTSASRDDSIRFLNEALALEPDFPQALAFRALLQAGAVLLTGAPRDILIDADRDALRALTIDPTLGDALVARGMIHADRREWLRADSHFGTARAGDPGNPFIENLHALTVLRPTGQLARARANLTATYRANPADGFTLHELTLTYSLLGDDAQMWRHAQLSETLSGLTRHPWDVLWAFARAETRRRAFRKAHEWALQALPASLHEAGGERVLTGLYGAHADASRAPQACREIEAFRPALERPQVDARTRAFFIASLAEIGSVDGAYTLLDRLLSATGPGACSVDLSDLWLPEMQAFRADPRFAGFTERAGLAQYWRASGTAPVSRP